jgi:hypothetical protein
MQILFTRWSLDPASRTSISVDPTRVDATEEFGQAFTTAWGEDHPASTKIIMKNKQEYVVQGAVADVVSRLNNN